MEPLPFIVAHCSENAHFTNSRRRWFACVERGGPREARHAVIAVGSPDADLVRPRVRREASVR